LYLFNSLDIATLVLPSMSLVSIPSERRKILVMLFFYRLSFIILKAKPIPSTMLVPP